MIRLEQVSYHYGRQFSLEDLSLQVKAGELVTVVGPNGAGKSTLLKLAAGHLIPKSGKISIDGKNAATLKPLDIARSLAYLSQSGLSSDLPVSEVVLHGRFPHTAFPHQYGKEDREMAKEAMLEMGIFDLACRPLSTLSGGERQKAIIAMALCQNCNAILLDEPTTFLDPYHGMSLMERLNGLTTKGKSILCVLHDLPLALRYSHRIAVLDHGRLVAQDTPENLIVSGVFTDVFGISMKKSEDGFYYYTSIKK